MLKFSRWNKSLAVVVSVFQCKIITRSLIRESCWYYAGVLHGSVTTFIKSPHSVPFCRVLFPLCFIPVVGHCHRLISFFLMIKYYTCVRLAWKKLQISNSLSIPDGHMINTNCSSSHNRKALCCKMSVEFDTFIDTDKK